MWEAAQFCVLAKLRTPLGKPQDTFTAIESTLKKYAAEVKSRQQDDVKPQLNSDSHKGKGEFNTIYSVLSVRFGGSKMNLL